MGATDRSRPPVDGGPRPPTEGGPRPPTEGTWRTGDLRGDEGAPHSVDSVVRATWWGIVVGRHGECVLIGTTALLLVLAAGNLGGAALGRWDLWCVAGLAALLAALAWSLEHRVRPVDVARALDDRLRHQGALFTAWELETAPPEQRVAPMGRLLVGQVLTRLRRGEAVRALFPSLVVPVAAPLVAAAALAASLERTRPEVRPSAVLEVSGEIVAELDALRAATIDEEGPYLEAARKLRTISSAARDLDRRLPGLVDRDPDAALAELESIDRDLAALAPTLPPAEELRSSLSAARSWVDSARQALQEEMGPRGPEPTEPDAAGGPEGQTEDPGEAPPGPPTTPGAGSDTSGGTPGVTESGGDGTMSGSPLGETAPGSPPAGAAEPAPDAPELGSAAGVWWPAAYDDVVRRWSDARSIPSADD